MILGKNAHRILLCYIALHYFFSKRVKKWGISCRCREKFITLHGNILLTHAYDARKYTV